jgi:hypothetical protein
MAILTSKYRLGNGRAVHGPTRTASVLSAVIAVLALASCAGETPEKTNDKIAKNPSKPVKIMMLASQFPKTPQSNEFTRVGQDDFINGSLGSEIVVGVTPDGFVARDEADRATAEGVFPTLPGFLFMVEPAADVKVTLTARGRLQSIRRATNPKNNHLAVSLAEFPEVYPPSFRERYELTLSSLPGAAAPFTFTYAFIIRSESTVSAFLSELRGDGADKMPFATDVAGFTLATLSVAGRCEACTIAVKAVEARVAVKHFAELPAVPLPGRDRLSTPARFSGVLTKVIDTPIVASFSGAETGSVSLKVSIPAAATTAKPWCYEAEGLNSRCLILGAPTYFKSVNAVGQNDGLRLLGHTAGVVSYFIAGKATVSVKRGGAVVETRTFDFFSDQASILSSTTLPIAAIDDIRTAVLSGRPEFPMP